MTGWAVFVSRMGKVLIAFLLLLIAFAAVLTQPTMNMLRAKKADKDKAADSRPVYVMPPSNAPDALAPPPAIPDAKRYPL